MKKKLLIIILLVILGLITVYPVFAQFVDREPQAILPSIRMKGMGGAVVGAVRDDDACFWNPAAYSWIVDGDRQFYINILEIGIRGSINDTSLINDTSDFIDKVDFDDLTTLRSEVDFINNIFKSRLGFGINGPLNSGFVWHLPYFDGRIGLGFKAFSMVDTLLKIRQEGFFPREDLLAVATKGAIAGGSYSFGDGKGSIGLNLKYLSRWRFIADEVTVIDIATFEDYLKNNGVLYTGYAIGVDLGAMYEVYKNLTVGMSILDVGGTNFHYKLEDDFVNSLEDFVAFNSGDDYQRAIPPTVNFGMGYFIPEIPHVPSWLLGDVILAADVQDLVSTRTNFFTRLHFGSEISVFPKVLRKWIGLPLRLRLGLNQGYFACGAGLTFLKVWNIDFAYWKDEIGLSPGQIPQTNIGLTSKFML